MTSFCILIRCQSVSGSAISKKPARLGTLHQNLKFKGTVSQTAHVQVINQKWSDVFKFVTCETKWRQQAEDNPHSDGGRRNNSGREQFFFNSGSGRKKEREKSRRRIRLEINIYKLWLQAKLEATYSSTRNSEFAMNLLSLENPRR